MMMRKQVLPLMGLLLATLTAVGQPDRWQQRAEYTMAIDFDVTTHRFTGVQSLVYFNNSPDTLDKVFYHLYFNAFQPGSMMDVRSRTIADPDRRVMDRIYQLSEDEIGYHRINVLEQDGKAVDFQVENTILEVGLHSPILPGERVTLYMEFDSQVPVQIRRSGRDNKEGIDYSMAQWYPKLCEYDYQGWHANPYIAREFYGVWGDFDVTIAIDQTYVIGGTGYLQDPESIGHGYAENASPKPDKNGKLSWNFVAEDVHDFMWAADPDYLHDVVQVPDGPALHFFYQNDDEIIENWKNLQGYSVRAFQFLSDNYGKYPYDKYSIIQGGDGGMEYPMATLITGRRSFRSLLGVTVHEAIHSWYQMVLGTNESLYAWMDEGFTSYATAVTMYNVYDVEENPEVNPFRGSYNNYFALVKAGLEEPLTTHSDHYNTNSAYGTGSYSKGAISIQQLGYVIGQENLYKGLKRYFDTWKFKHPNRNDFMRVMEKTSGIELDWYYEYWVNTTNTIDYGIQSVEGSENETKVMLSRVGKMPMPLDIVVGYTDGTTEEFYIPLTMMRGEKPNESEWERTTYSDWPWTHPYYELVIPRASSDIDSIEIDPSERMADVDRTNNRYPFFTGVEYKGKAVK